MLRWILDHWIRWRWANRVYARVMGYCWDACPLCDRAFGGHERDNAGFLMVGWNEGTIVCRRCRGKAKYRNWRDWDVYEGTGPGGTWSRSYGFRGKVGAGALGVTNAAGEERMARVTDDHVTPGPYRAARAICNTIIQRIGAGFVEDDFPAGGVDTFRDIFARIIDEQSGLKELLQASEALVWEVDRADAVRAAGNQMEREPGLAVYPEAKNVIAKAKGE